MFSFIKYKSKLLSSERTLTEEKFCSTNVKWNNIFLESGQWYVVLEVT